MEYHEIELAVQLFSELPALIGEMEAENEKRYYSGLVHDDIDPTPLFDVAYWKEIYHGILNELHLAGVFTSLEFADGKVNSFEINYDSRIVFDSPEINGEKLNLKKALDTLNALIPFS